MNQDIEYILSKFDLVQLVEQAGSPMKKYSADWRGPCPIHKGQDKTAFSVYNESGKQKFKCFSGDCPSGDIVDFYMAWQNVDYKTAMRYFMGDVKPDPSMMTKIAAEHAERTERRLKETIEAAQKVLKELQEARAWEKYHQQLEDSVEARELWESRGIPEVFQDIWHLGYCDNFHASTSEGLLVTPSLTIPIFGPAWELLNIRHRLLNPVNPKDKYRPDKPGLQSHAFMTDPDLGMKAENMLIVEGEIKSMVTYITLDFSEMASFRYPRKNMVQEDCRPAPG